MAQSSKSKPRLGRGLSSLISSSALPVEAEAKRPSSGKAKSPATSLEDGFGDFEAVNPTPIDPAALGSPLMVPIDLIAPNPHQPRRTIKEDAIAELALSLKSTGIIQPVVLRRLDHGFQLIAGERRWLASRLAGMNEIPAIVRDVDAFEQAQMALVENIQREDLNPIDRAEGYHTLMIQLGLTQSELALRMGEERSSIANYLRLMDLCEAVRVMVRDGQLTLGHAKLLAGVSEPGEQTKLAERTISQGLSVRNLERLLAQPLVSVEPLVLPAKPSAHLADLEKTLSHQLGLRVQVKSAKKGRGKLILNYNSLDQFDELVAKLGGKVSEE